MVNKPKAKGTAAETAVLQAVIGAGFPDAQREILHGASDQGDIVLCKGVIVEVKNCKTPSIPAWLRETEAERINAGADHGFLVYKKPGLGMPNALLWPAVVRAAWLWRLLGEAVERETFIWPTWTSKPAHGHPDDLSMYEVTMTLADMLGLLKVAGYGGNNDR